MESRFGSVSLPAASQYGFSTLGASLGASTAASATHAGPAVAAVAPIAGDVRSIIAAKERELHDISEYRAATLEAALAEKVRGVVGWLNRCCVWG
jgi:hypothetical protein